MWLDKRGIYSCKRQTVSIACLTPLDSSAQRVYQQENLTGVAFSRVFGNEESAGLYISMKHDDGKTGLLFSPIDKVRSSGQLSLRSVLSIQIQPWHDFSLTAEGQLLLVDEDGAFYAS